MTSKEPTSAWKETVKAIAVLVLAFVVSGVILTVVMSAKSDTSKGDSTQEAIDRLVLEDDAVLASLARARVAGVKFYSQRQTSTGLGLATYTVESPSGGKLVVSFQNDRETKRIVLNGIVLEEGKMVTRIWP